MENSNKYWENLAEKIQKPSETKNKRPDTSDLEIDFLKAYVTNESTVLDIGSGTGLIINKLLPFVKHITAVEKFEGFTRHIVEAPNMLVINADLLGFKIRQQFDVVLCTGVAQCFTRNDTAGIYASIFDMLRPGGQLILRTHCGLQEDVIINGYSEELQTDYFAEYRQKDKELQLLHDTGFADISTHDIFPDTLNVWDNTRHFIFVCTKPN